MDEILQRDQNHIVVLGGITDDSNENITMLRVDPITKRLQVTATVPGTSGGQIKITSADTAFGYISTKLVAGIGITLTVNNPGGNETLTIDASGSGSGYDLIENNGTPVTQRSTINLSTLLTATDSGGKTALTINTTNLAADSTFITAITGNSTFLNNIANSATFVNTLVANNTFTTALAGNTNFINTLTANSTFQSNIVTVINASGTISINLASQVTGTLPVANGGTGATTITGILKGNGTSPISAASAGTDYVAPGAITTSGLTMATARLLGRTTASTGAVEEITVGSGLSLSAGTLSAIGGTTQNFTAAQDIITGDPVGASNGVEGSVAFAGFTHGVRSQIVGFAVNSTVGAISRISVNKYVMAFTEDGSNDKQVVVLTIDPDTYEVTFGTPVTFTALSIGGVYDITQIDTDKFILGYSNSATDDVYGRVGTVSGTTITLGTETNLYAQTTTLGAQIIIQSADTDRAVFITTRNNGGGTNVDIEATGISISGTTPTAGTPTTIDTFIGASGSSFSLVSNQNKNIVKTSAGKYFALYKFTTGGVDTLRIVVMTQSGTTMTIGTPVDADSAASTNWIGTALFTSDKVVIGYSDGTGEIAVVSISGTVPTLGTPVSTGTVTATFFTDATSVWFSLNGGSLYRRWTVSGTTLSNSGEAPFSPVTPLSTFISSEDADGLLFAYTFPTISTFDIGFFGQSNNFIGVATNTVSKGATVTVQLSGEATINQDVNSGSFYYVLDGIFETLTTAPGTAATYQMWGSVKGSGLNKIIL